MLLIENPRLEISGNFAFMDGKLVKDIRNYSVGEVWGRHIKDAIGIKKQAYSVTTISYNSRNFNIFIIPYMEIGDYYTKIIPHRANYTEYYQVLWGNPFFEAWKEESDGAFTVRKGPKRPMSTIAIHNDERIGIFNHYPERAIVLSYTSGNLEDSEAKEPIMLGPNVMDIDASILVKRQEELKSENISLVPLLEKACRNLLKK
ncbi:MAG: hypothetical protein NTY68_05060 [Candidatus Micrarchaeota archaeon]|nr:hypothetical protein [Candidatus Micrarchaeota archaeon]